MKNFAMKKTALAMAAAMIVSMSGILPLNVSAAIDLENLPTPVSAESSAVKEFEKQKPTVTLERSTYYYANVTLQWKPVKNALYYEVWSRTADSKEFSLDSKTLDTIFYDDFQSGRYKKYKVRAVTYTYDDEPIYSEFSNVKTYSVPKDRDHDDYYEVGSDGASVDASVSEEAIEEEADISYSPEPAPTGAVQGLSYDSSEELPYYYNTEEYSDDEESAFKNAVTDPVSTFSVDTDTASYANLRRMINENRDIPTDAVRIEEMLNYFDYDYPAPKADGAPFSVYTELSDCPWNDDAKLMMIGLQGKEVTEDIPSNLVFLVDVSGSMYSDDKLPLAVKSLNMLTSTMTDNDRISIVTYSGNESVLVAGAKGDQVNMISELTSLLWANGSTNGESGIKAAYAIAEKYYIKGGNNRIILCTDGDLNVGISSEDELKKLIEEKRESGVYFSVMGFGTGNIKDNKMEILADNGNGSYYYIDSPQEAQKVLVEERDSTLFTIAKDVKIQIEFNPAAVGSYRLIGYDNRRLENADFSDDKKDAGEIGAGHSVTALYEIIPAKDGGNGLKYSSVSKAAESGEWATVKLRYKEPDAKNSKLITKVIGKNAYKKTMTDRMKFAAAVAEAGLVLKNSDYKGTSTIENAFVLAASSCGTNYYKKEFAELLLESADPDKVKLLIEETDMENIG